MNPTSSQRATRLGLPRDHAFQQRVIGAVGVCRFRIVPVDDVIGQPPHALGIAARREKLERADANVAGGDAGEDGPGQRRLAHHALAGHDSGERARGGNAECRHRLADDVFAQHRTKRGTAIAPAREGRRARPLELDVTADTVGVDHLAEQDGAAVPELRHEMTELVAGIGHRNRVGAVGDPLAGEDLGALRAVEPIRVEAEMEGQRPVQFDQSAAQRPASARPARKSWPAAPHRCFRRGNGPSWAQDRHAPELDNRFARRVLQSSVVFPSFFGFAGHSERRLHSVAAPESLG